MIVPATTDILQEVEGKLEVPEIRVWVHPFEGGNDYYKTFDTFADAKEFIGKTKGAESNPLIAFRGYELNLWEMQSQEKK